MRSQSLHSPTINELLTFESIALFAYSKHTYCYFLMGLTALMHKCFDAELQVNWLWSRDGIFISHERVNAFMQSAAS